MPDFAIVALVVAGFASLLGLAGLVLLLIDHINPDLFDRIDNFLFGPPEPPE